MSDKFEISFEKIPPILMEAKEIPSKSLGLFDIKTYKFEHKWQKYIPKFLHKLFNIKSTAYKECNIQSVDSIKGNNSCLKQNIHINYEEKT